ncbi:hypothetical protein D3C81_1896290 [compost metagenome]
MAPPLAMRRTASRQQRKQLVTLVVRVLLMRSALISSTFICGCKMPALFTRWVMTPSLASISSNSRTTSASTLTSACTAMQATPWRAWSSATSASAAARCCR